MKIIKRETYLKQLIDVKDIPDIKVITGIRRAGKSKLMDMYRDYLAKENSNNIVHINLNLIEFSYLTDSNNLYQYIVSKYNKNKSNYLLIDEIQMCIGFEKIITSLYEEQKFDIYITGSNAFLLSSDLATLFRGRVFEIKVFPFSFREFMNYYDLKDVDASFDLYFKNGGMAGSYLYRNETDSIKYIEEIVKTTIIRDIVEKYKIENEDLLKMIYEFLMDNIGSQTSIRNIANKLTSCSYIANDKTCGTYIEYLCRSFLFYSFQRFDIKGNKYLESDKKYYLSDLSFRRAILGNRYTDIGHLYENLVGIELLRRGYEVYVGKMYQKEIDFVALKCGQKNYIQVSYDITNKDTFNREVMPLLSIKDAYPKIIISRTKSESYDYEGIKIIDIAKWLSTDM